MLTLQQKQTLKTWLLANAGSMNEQQAADALNAAASPAWQVYKTAVPLGEIMLNGFNWTRVDNLSVGKARIWEWLFSANAESTINPSKPNIRAGINATWVGTQADLDVRDAVYAHCYRAGSVADKLLGSGAGTAPANDGDGSGPGVAGYDALITPQDVIDSLNV